MDHKKRQDEKVDKWKEKFNVLVSSAQTEIKKTAEIGRKMISATKTNTSLNDCYQTLGKLIYKDFKDKTIQLDSVKAKTIIESIDNLKAELDKFEEQVQDIKKQNKQKDL